MARLGYSAGGRGLRNLPLAGGGRRRVGQMTAPEAAGTTTARSWDVLDEKDLTLAFKRGEQDAYGVIYARYGDRVRRIARRMLADPHDAEEASQETFLRVYQALPRFNGRYQLGAWITRIATNVCLDHLRARTRRPSEPAPIEVLDFVADHGDRLDDPERSYLRKAEGSRVRRVLASLPPTHRAAIVLRDFEGLSYAEIAGVLDMTECQVKALIHRARQSFKRSWTTRLAALLPFRNIQRFFQRLEAPTEQATNALGQIAPSCSAFLSTCGQIVADRATTIVTAAMAATAVSTAAVALPAVAPVRAQAPEVRAETRLAPVSHRSPSRPHKRVVAAEEEVVPEIPSEPAASPAPEPEPSPTQEPGTPTPEPTETPGPGGTTTTDRQTIPSSAPSFYFDFGQPFAAPAPTVRSESVDCDAVNVDQHIETQVGHGGGASPGVIDLDVSSSLSFEMTITKDGRTVPYVGGAALVGSNHDSVNDYLKLEFSGSYGTGAETGSLGLPSGGRFHAALTLDCDALSVVQESVVFQTQ